MPFRNNWTEIISNGPHDKVVVPNDVIVWNPYNQTWKFNDNVNATALTKILTDNQQHVRHGSHPVPRVRWGAASG